MRVLRDVIGPHADGLGAAKHALRPRGGAAEIEVHAPRSCSRAKHGPAMVNQRGNDAHGLRPQRGHASGVVRTAARGRSPRRGGDVHHAAVMAPHGAMLAVGGATRVRGTQDRDGAGALSTRRRAPYVSQQSQCG